jgi:hypothetical protein
MCLTSVSAGQVAAATLSAMPDEPPPERSVAKVRIGLALIGVVILVALVMSVVVEAPAGKAIMFAIAVTAVVRAYLLYRSLRREQQAT